MPPPVVCTVSMSAKLEKKKSREPIECTGLIFFSIERKRVVAKSKSDIGTK